MNNLFWPVVSLGALGLALGIFYMLLRRFEFPANSPDIYSSLPPTASSAKPNPSLTAVDYSKLEGFLKAGQWKEADQETVNLMLKVADQEQTGGLDEGSIKSFPCDVLSKIDLLWVNNSGGKFGFSVQNKIYVEECGGSPDGHYDKRSWQCFGEQVGWRVNNEWIDYFGGNLDISAKRGHLPRRWRWDREWEVVGVRFSSLVQRLAGCA
ncbi:MAG: GUN4 domain-containing protein [Gammaproteobacteria bacterium]